MSRYLKVSLRFGGSVHTDAFSVGKTFQAGGKPFSRPKKQSEQTRSRRDDYHVHHSQCKLPPYIYYFQKAG